MTFGDMLSLLSQYMMTDRGSNGELEGLLKRKKMDRLGRACGGEFWEFSNHQTRMRGACPRQSFGFFAFSSCLLFLLFIYLRLPNALERLEEGKVGACC